MTIYLCIKNTIFSMLQNWLSVTIQYHDNTWIARMGYSDSSKSCIFFNRYMTRHPRARGAQRSTLHQYLSTRYWWVTQLAPHRVFVYFIYIHEQCHRREFSSRCFRVVAHELIPERSIRGRNIDIPQVTNMNNWLNNKKERKSKIKQKN